MEIIEHLVTGFSVAFTLQNVFLVFIGCLSGTIIGMLPGIGPVNAIAILFPIVYILGLPAASALIFFSGIFYGSQYGNSISSILMNVPGTSSSAVTSIDGYVMAKQGRAGQALAMSAIASFIGGTLSIFLLILFAPLLAQLAIDFGPAEYTVLMLFAFLALSAFNDTSLPKTMISAFLGLAIASVGIDPLSGVPRLAYGSSHFYDGIDFIVVVIGFFAIGELLEMLSKTSKGQEKISKFKYLFISFEQLRRSFLGILRSCLSGFFIGVLPGAGATIASFIAYASEKRLTPNNNFGKGDVHGVAAPESANNSSAVGSFIPLLILGVPGSETTAVMLGGLTSLGLSPGPGILTSNPEVFWGLVASMFIGNLFLIILNLPLVGVFVSILRTPRSILMPLIALLSTIGVYTASGSAFDIVLMTIFGIVGWIMRRTGFPLAPLILGVVLGGMIETNLRRALVYSDGSFGIFFSSTICIVLWVLCLATYFFPKIVARFKS